MGNFKKNFAKWKIENNEHGPRAMTRFVIMQFVTRLETVAPNRYIFKGGNLLWHYIKTPRSTVDLDFATDSKLEIHVVLTDFSRVLMDGYLLKIKTYQALETIEKSSLSVQLEFLSEDGSKNLFGVDVVFAIKTHRRRIKIANVQITAASLENIIIDKISSCQKFAGGNTRMKDFDDLYRIAISDQTVEAELIQ